nr:MAG TPA: hypothetical protein [Caudoviricetes sp.]DAW65902.1 MAG TPA: hypothetical protein [Bacteriophage sp.]
MSERKHHQLARLTVFLPIYMWRDKVVLSYSELPM